MTASVSEADLDVKMLGPELFGNLNFDGIMENIPHITLVTLWFVIVRTDNCLLNGTIRPGQLLTNASFTHLSHFSLYSCAGECSGYVICRSFNFNKISKTCFLNFADDTTGPYVTENHPDFVYSIIRDWPKEIAGACKEHDCKKEEKCKVTRNNRATCVKSPSHGVDYRVDLILSTEVQNWNESVAECSRLYGNLAVVDTQNKSKKVENIIRNRGWKDFVWLGATEAEEAGLWMWINGREMTFDTWSPYYNQPFDHSGIMEDCLATIYENPNDYWDWFDRKCSNTYLYVCEVITPI